MCYYVKNGLEFLGENSLKHRKFLNYYYYYKLIICSAIIFF